MTHRTAIALAVGAVLLSSIAATPPVAAQPVAHVVAKKKPKKNRLIVRFVGTPAAAALPITVRGPKVRKGKRYVRSLTTAKTLKRVPAGTYRVSSPDPTASISPSTFRMKKKTRKTVTVTFAPVADTTPPDRVTSLTVGQTGIHRVRLSWQTPADAASVIVRRTYGDAPAASPDDGVPVEVSANSVDDVGLLPRTAYTYTVFARDAAGNTSGAAVARVTTAIRPIAAGAYHTCAIVSGTMKCWGLDNHAQLGDGLPKTSRNIPQNVVGLPAGVDVVAIGAGDFHTCAVMANGTLWCWGDNGNGKIGDGSVGGDKASPTQVSGITDAVDVAAGFDHTCVLQASGAVRCWGAAGRLGTGFNAGSASPVVVAGLTDAVGIFADGDRSCAVRRTGAVVCWGRGAAGEIGDGDSVDRYAPVPVIGLSNVTSVATGPNHACAMGADVRCWGANFYGQAGDGTTNSPRATAGPVSGFSGRVLTASLGVNHSCLLKGDGSAVCWGDNTNKQLGASGAPPGNQLAPVNVSLLSGATTAVSGVLHTCALLPEGTVKCWGRNLEYQLGTGDDTPSDVPIPVLFLDVYP